MRAAVPATFLALLFQTNDTAFANVNSEHYHAQAFPETSFVKSLMKKYEKQPSQETNTHTEKQSERRTLSGSQANPNPNSKAKAKAKPTFLNSHRRFQGQIELSRSKTRNAVTAESSQTSNESCDAQFFKCVTQPKCASCFNTIQDADIDWATVTPETPCKDVVEILFKNSQCMELSNDQAGVDDFCVTFNSCVVWDEEGEKEEKKKEEDRIDCDALNTCEWEGMHKGYLGDGICHDRVHGCYNHKVCNYDNGDCCQDSCKDVGEYVNCGAEGYYCRDPISKNCDPTITDECDGDDMDDYYEDPIDCKSAEAAYRLIQYDSWGDGWDETAMSITKSGDTEPIYQGKLEEGSSNTEYICLTTEGACYDVEVSGGIWGKEVSWEIKPLMNAPAIADGGSPVTCSFPVGSATCKKTCAGMPNTKDIAADKNYRTFKQMATCIREKCMIQFETCNQDQNCKPCLNEDVPAYCYANPGYMALIKCSLCKCAPNKDDEEMNSYCNTQPTGSNPAMEEKKEKTGTLSTCTSEEILRGTDSVFKYSQCSDIDKLSAMVTDYDENNFGALDAFEDCAAIYNKEPYHGGKSAMDCMRILVNAINEPDNGSANKIVPVDAVSSLASHLYRNGESFCECTFQTNELCPMCSNFAKFKTLLHESLDACQSLDIIDCDAWVEFYSPCKENIVREFGKVDFKNDKQCGYIQDTCGHVGPFPSFRKLDCGTEISKQAWDFYTEYSRGCLNANGGTSPTPAVPSPTPPTPPTPTPPVPVVPGSGSFPIPYVPAPDSSVPKPYIPAGTKPSRRKGVKRFFWFVFISAIFGGAFWYYKKRSSSFDFVRYRRTRNYGPTDSMYEGLAMDTRDGSFEPPSLPPPPSAYVGPSVA